MFTNGMSESAEMFPNVKMFLRHVYIAGINLGNDIWKMFLLINMLLFLKGR